jgi:DNA polymerase/3'-5' exonuclease PolX
LRAVARTRYSVQLRDGFQVDLRVIAIAIFDAAMQYLLGSCSHNIAL